MQKAREKAWHDLHIKQHTLINAYLVLMYDIKFRNFPRKFHMQWLGPYIIKEIADGGVVQLIKLNGELFLGRMNGI